jgi:hypothetical protein
MAQMLDGIKINSKLWAKFTEEAKRSKKDPMRLLSEMLRDYVERRENERLLRGSSRVARRSGLTEDDDIEGIIREFRKKRAEA